MGERKPWPYSLAPSIGFTDLPSINNKGIQFVGGHGVGYHGELWKL